MTVIERDAPATDDRIRVDLVLTQEIKNRIPRVTSSAIEMAEALDIDGPATAQWVAGQIREIDGRRGATKALYNEFIAGAMATINTARKWFFPSIVADERVAGIYRAKLTRYTTEQAENAAAARREAADRERAARLLAEAEADRIRAEARVAAREAQERIAEIHLEKQRAIEQNDIAALQESNDRAHAVIAEAAAIRDNAEAAAAATELAAAASVEVVAGPPKVEGFTTRKNWKADVDVDERDARDKIVAAVRAGRDDLVALLCVDMTAANAMAKAQEARFNVPGMRAMNRPIGVKGRAS